MAPTRRNRTGGHGGRGGAGAGASTGPRQTPEQQQVRAVYEALEAKDYDRLRELAFSRRGFCSSELRRAAWLCLLGVPQEKAVDASWRRLLAAVDSNGQDSRTMQVDVQRSVYSWDVHTGIRKTARNKKRIDLSEVMHGILQRHEGQFRYFQGFHDIALVFLEVGTPSQAFHMVERLALFHMTDQLCWPFDSGLVPLLRLLFSLLELVAPSCAQALSEADCSELHFAIPWVLTWFSHTLPRLHSQVMRLFDCLLSSHPAMILYFCAALLLLFEDDILRTERDMPEMVTMLQRLPLDTLDMEAWVERARRLAEQLPPEEFMNLAREEHLRGLPPTSPMLHYPHPWMRPGVQAASSASVTPRGQLQQQPQPQSAEDPILKLSPVYDKKLAATAHAAKHKAEPASSKPGRHSAMALLRMLSLRLRPAALLSLLAAAVAAFYASIRGRA